MKNQTRLRKAIWMWWTQLEFCSNDSLKSWVLNLLGRSSKRIDSSENIRLSQKETLSSREVILILFLSRKLMKTHSVLCLLVRKIKKILFIRKRLSCLWCSNLQLLSYRRNLYPWTTNSVLTEWLRFPKPFPPTLVSNPIPGLCASLDVKLPALWVARLDHRRFKPTLKKKLSDLVFVLMHPLQNSAWQNWANLRSRIRPNNTLRLTGVSETNLRYPLNFGHSL